MQPLNFKSYQFKLKSSENKPFIFDRIRKKYVVLTPEEWVRQHTVNYLIEELNYPLSRIAVERQLKVNKLTKRFDIVIFDTQGLPYILVECKAPKVAITQETFDQIARYNMRLNAPLLMLTNGLNHYFCTLNNHKKNYDFLENLPHNEK
ncbi:type I restriction enzyme HsdR N-terminal domain-containing protein [Urechidicola sp. KH5]